EELPLARNPVTCGALVSRRAFVVGEFRERARDLRVDSGVPQAHYVMVGEEALGHSLLAAEVEEVAARDIKDELIFVSCVRVRCELLRTCLATTQFVDAPMRLDDPKRSIDSYLSLVGKLRGDVVTDSFRPEGFFEEEIEVHVHDDELHFALGF